jgi:hypothetical protein
MGSIWEELLRSLCHGAEQVGQGLSVHIELRRSALQNALPNALSAQLQAGQFAGSPEHPAHSGSTSSAGIATFAALVPVALEGEDIVKAARNGFCLGGSGTAGATGGGLSRIDSTCGRDPACALAFTAASRSAALGVSCISIAPCKTGGGLKGGRLYS